MTQPRRGLAITDLLAIAAVLLLVAALGLPTLERARELSKRMVCATNLKALGGAGNVYADANKGQWMTPAFREKDIKQEGVAYLCTGPNLEAIACVGFERSRSTNSEIPIYPSAGSTAMSTTRAYWMLVRSGAITNKQFVCPSSQIDTPDPTDAVDAYYDFAEYTNNSYGYLVPFGPRETRPRSGAENRIIFAADKGPFYRDVNLDFFNSGPGNTPLEVYHTPSFWRPFNSPNHGGQANGEGQNALHADGHIEFCRQPTVGIDDDNIYTMMVDGWGIQPYNRTHGQSPHQSYARNPYPGNEAFGQCSNCYSTTDSLIYP